MRGIVYQKVNHVNKRQDPDVARSLGPMVLQTEKRCHQQPRKEIILT
jgi:hypothetical protein